MLAAVDGTHKYQMGVGVQLGGYTFSHNGLGRQALRSRGEEQRHQSIWRWGELHGVAAVCLSAYRPLP